MQLPPASGLQPLACITAGCQPVISRRQMLQIGGLGLMGLSLPKLLAAESTAARFALEYAAKVAAGRTGDGVCLEEQMALVFCAESSG